MVSNAYATPHVYVRTVLVVLRSATSNAKYRIVCGFGELRRRAVLFEMFVVQTNNVSLKIVSVIKLCEKLLFFTPALRLEISASSVQLIYFLPKKLLVVFINANNNETQKGSSRFYW
jgi:hypothetical protein